MDRQAAEAAGRSFAEVGGDQRDEAGDVGPGQALQEVAPAGGVGLAGDEVGERPVAHIGEVVAAVEGVADEPGLGEDVRVEAGREALGGGDGLGLIVEAQAGLEADRVGVQAEVVAGAEEQLAAGEPLVVRVAVAVAALPGGEDLVDLGELAAVLQLDAAPVVVLDGARQQRGDGGAAIVGEREGFELLEIHEDSEGMPRRAAPSPRSSG